MNLKTIWINKEINHEIHEQTRDTESSLSEVDLIIENMKKLLDYIC